LRKILRYLVMIPAALLLVVLALANRHPVSLSLDPFGMNLPGLTFEMPLFLPIFVAAILGVVLGGSALWLGQARFRRAARLHKREADRLRSEAQSLRESAAQASGIPASLLGRR